MALASLFQSRETYHVYGAAHPKSLKARRLEITQARLARAESKLRESRSSGSGGKSSDAAMCGYRRKRLPPVQAFAGRAISRGADGAWRVEGDPAGLGYSTLQDAQIAAQFMGRVA